MAYTYGTAPSDVAVDKRTGLPAIGIQITIWTDMDGQRITAGLRDLDGNPLPGYVPTDEDGRYPFTDDAERPYALWALTPEGDWYRLVANELQDQAGQIVKDFPAVQQAASEAKGDATEALTTANGANQRSIEALRVAEQANQTASIVIEPEWPLIVAHRGGANVWPEESREAMTDAARAGFPLEVDVRPLADGTLVCCHDNNVDRTMIDIGTGPVASKTLAQWRLAKIKSPINGGTTGTPMTFDEWLDAFGGSSLLVPEIKPGAADEEIDRFVRAILTRRLENSLIAQSFDLPACVKMAEAGLTTMFLAGAATVVDIAQVTDAGISLIGTARTRPVADVQAWQAAGMKVVAYTVKTRAEHQAALTAGFDGVFSDDPWATSGRVPVLSGSPFSGGHKPYGMDIRATVDSTPTDQVLQLAGSSLAIGSNVSGLNNISQPWFGKWGNRMELEIDVEFGPDSTGQNSNLGFWLLSGPNEWPLDKAAANQRAVTGIVRRSGVLDLYVLNPGAAANKVATVNGPLIAAAGDAAKATIIFRMSAAGSGWLAALGPGGYAKTPTASTFVPSGINDWRLFVRTNGVQSKFLDIRVSDNNL